MTRKETVSGLGEGGQISEIDLKPGRSRSRTFSLLSVLNYFSS